MEYCVYYDGTSYYIEDPMYVGPEAELEQVFSSMEAAEVFCDEMNDLA